ncbi:alkaline phosphatase [Paracoccus shanxieyensis]|uniref:Alkaline phosphatase n=1 Tax=Paracoccus shanxieyensis TaxID=2675752 RepID=A0A6L6IQF7_9RHOB|nr:alkaline phosphatase [Paracoccus shanxieyensis]MTH62716.1 alkaline phosphatase [Paracoccus shanxieyensis]MTH86200.1 alkaline phosphatase [Paracoccus shanxieyensis]
MAHILRSLTLGASVLSIASAAMAQETVMQSQDSYYTAAQAELARKIADEPNTGRAKNVVLFVVDGLSIPTITASRIYEGQLRGVDGESNSLSFERLLPYVALSKTYTHDAQVADSAPTATAMVSGVKSVNGTIGVTQAIQPDVCASQKGAEVTTIFEQAEAAGLATGIVSTARITHATPAATYAKVAGRDWESNADLTEEAVQNGCKDIAAQLIDWPAGDGFEVVMGGGRGNFMTTEQKDPEDETKTGSRTDGRDLIAEWQAKHNDGAYVWNKEGFDALNLENTNKVFALFNRSHMQYDADREKDAGGEPSLAEMAVTSLDVLSKNDKGYVLMIEGGRVDHAHHAGNAARALTDTIAVAKAVDAVFEKINPEETLVILTADHSHVFSIAGYPKRNNPILGIAGTGDDNKPYTTLGYMNGPGAKLDEPRADLSGVDTTDIDFLQQALVPLGESETHAGDDVAIFAQGPWAHLFHGVVEQNLIYHVIAHATDMANRAAADQN